MSTDETLRRNEQESDEWVAAQIRNKVGELNTFVAIAARRGLECRFDTMSSRRMDEPGVRYNLSVRICKIL